MDVSDGFDAILAQESEGIKMTRGYYLLQGVMAYLIFTPLSKIVLFKCFLYLFCKLLYLSPKNLKI